MPMIHIRKLEQAAMVLRVAAISLLSVWLAGNVILPIGCPSAGGSELIATQSLTAPVISNCPPFMFSGYACNAVSWDFNATPAAGCESLMWTITATNYQPVGPYVIDQNGVFRFTFDSQDGGALVEFSVTVTDNCGAADTCVVRANSLNSRQYFFQIGKASATFGDEITIPIRKLAGSDEMASFDFTISHDPCILNFISAELGQSFGSSGCNWEYFTYRVGSDGPAYPSCYSGNIRLTAIADLNNGDNHPSCNLLPDGESIVNLHYKMTHDHQYECVFAPIRFVWNNCLDNTVRSQFGDILNTSCKVFDYGNANPDTSSLYELTDSDCSDLWHYGGSCGMCDTASGVNDRHFSIFWNGGVDIPCDDSAHCIRGDMNVNMIAYDNGDLVTYINYWYYGLPALDINPPAQICNSDVNGDGITLTVGDVVYMFRIMAGDVPALVPKLESQPSAEAVMNNRLLTVFSNVAIGGMLLDFEAEHGSVPVIRNLTEFEMTQGFAVAGEYRILLLPSLERMSTRLMNGHNPICEFSGDVKLTKVEVVDYYGNPIAIDRASLSLPTEFSLSQNSPNPFNPVTTINISLPILSDWSLEIINVSGQVVREFAGRDIGTVQIEWNASEQSSGVYFYRLKSGAFECTKKMVLLK